MPTKNIRRGPSGGGAPTDFLNRPNASDVYIDGSTNVLVFGAAASGTTAKTAVDTTSTQTLSGKTLGATTFSGLFNELAQDSIVAGTTQTQAGATVITGQTARVSTVGTIGDGVLLPPSAAGLEVMIINHGANAMKVYGAGADQIDDQTNTVGVSQMANSLVIYSCATAGNWYSEGLASGFGGPGLQTISFVNTITAGSTQTQAGATALTGMINRVTTTAAAGDGVRLPTSAAGLQVIVDNRAANQISVYGAGTDTVNGIVTTTGFPQGVNTVVTYTCVVAGNWETSFTGGSNVAVLALAANTAIPPHHSGTYVITKVGVEVNTIAAPTVTTDDGVMIEITSDNANLHTLTFTGNTLDSGSASVAVATWAAQKGATLRIMAFNGRWKAMSQVGITFT